LPVLFHSHPGPAAAAAAAAAQLQLASCLSCSSWLQAAQLLAQRHHPLLLVLVLVVVLRLPLLVYCLAQVLLSSYLLLHLYRHTSSSSSGTSKHEAESTFTWPSEDAFIIDVCQPSHKQLLPCACVAV
jgi:hypothetical protein